MVSFFLCLFEKKKSAGAIEKNSVSSVFRVFEQKKRKGVCRFLNPDLARQRDTGTRRHAHERKNRTTITTTTRNNNTNEKSKSE